MNKIDANKLRLLIAEKGYNIRSLARAAGVAEPTINCWLHGRGARLDVLARVALALKMPLPDFIQAIAA